MPYLSVALAHNQDVRLMAPALPGVAVLVAGAVGAIRRPRARLALAGVAVLALAYTTLNHVTAVKPGFLPENATLSAGPYVAVVPLGSTPIGYEQLPGPDYATPVIEYIEDVARAEPGGLSAPRTVCLLESEAVANSNTFGYLSSAREDPFVFADVVLGPEGRKGLRSGACRLRLRPLRQTAQGPRSRGAEPGRAGQPALRRKPHDAAAVQALPRPKSYLPARQHPEQRPTRLPEYCRRYSGAGAGADARRGSAGLADRGEPRRPAGLRTW